MWLSTEQVPLLENVPKLVAGITLVAGAALAASPGPVTGVLGLDDQQIPVRALGVADLLLVPGLFRGRSPSSWMVARSALSLAQAAYLDGVAARCAKPALAKAGAFTLYGLSAADITTAVMLNGTTG